MMNNIPVVERCPKCDSNPYGERFNDNTIQIYCSYCGAHTVNYPDTFAGFCAAVIAWNEGDVVESPNETR